MRTDIIFPFINFFLFLFLLVWFSRKPVRALLDKKRIVLQIQLEAALLAKNAAEAAALELQEKTLALGASLQKFRDDAKLQSALFTEESSKRGVLLAERIAKETQEMMASEFLRAQAQLQTGLLSMVEAAVIEKVQHHQGSAKQNTAIAQEMQTVTRLLAEENL